MDPRKLRDAIADYVPARVLEPAFAWTVAAGYAAKFRGLGAVRANRRLRDIRVGERCFVLGTGPSLRTHDLSKLAAEYVFTVNSFVLHARELGVTPACHVVMDPYYFDESRDRGVTLRAMQQLPDETLCIAPLHFKPVVDRYVPRCAYVLPAGDFAGNSNADLSRPIPSLYSVTNLALLAALHMGFSTIYLLGCEMDLLSRVEGVQPLRIRESHYYEDAQSVADWSELGFDYTRYAEMVLKMFEGFRFCARSCRPGQQIINATPGGLLDVFPRTDFKTLF